MIISKAGISVQVRRKGYTILLKYSNKLEHFT